MNGLLKIMVPKSKITPCTALKLPEKKRLC